MVCMGEGGHELRLPQGKGRGSQVVSLDMLCEVCCRADGVNGVSLRFCKVHSVGSVG